MEFPGDHSPINPNFLSGEVSFSLVEMEKAISLSQGNKAPGADGTPVDLFKCNLPLWAPLLLKVFHATLQVGKINTWSLAIIVPIFKKGDRADPTCFRPISLPDSFLKIVGRMILARLEGWAEQNQIMGNVQYGFRKGIGTVEQCLNLSLTIGKYTIAKPGRLYLAFMDLSCAFDSVSHAKLWDALSGGGD